MNLIEQLGGYERAKAFLNAASYTMDELIMMQRSGLRTQHVEKALLEYRRQHNIFEVGDWVVFRECSGIGGASDAIDLMTVKSIDAFGVRMTNSLCPWAIQIRHATDEEIKAGRRL